ncbi:MAG: hypothetical protein ACOYYU_14520 [Chloroflexota bacterium]
MSGLPSLADAIRAACLRFQGVDRLYLESAIDSKRMQNARSAMRIPEQETVILLYDDSLLENNKVGFAVCAGGLYWKNDWSVGSRRTRLSWGEFAQRKRIREKDLAVDLTRGDRIGLAVLGEAERAQVIALLEEIQAVCKKEFEAGRG